MYTHTHKHNVAFVDVLAHARKYESYEESSRAVERVVHIADAPRVYAPGIHLDDKGPSFKVFNASSLVDGPICPRYSGVNCGKHIAIRPRLHFETRSRENAHVPGIRV